MLDYKRKLEILDNFATKKVLVIGDIMIDEYLSGKVTRISPEAPVPIIEIDDEVLRFGGAANVALNLKKLGCEPLLVGVIGNDRFGNIFQQLMEKENLANGGLIQSKMRPTSVKTRIIGDNQHIARVDKESTVLLNSHEEEEFVQKVMLMIKSADAVIMEDYDKGLFSVNTISLIIDIALQNNIPILVDPKFRNFKSYKKVTVFKPNIKETEQALAVKIDNEEEIKSAGFKLLKMLNVESVLLTLGGKGMVLFEENNQMTHIPTQVREVADVSGAGDTVISTMTAALLGKASKKEAAVLANIAAGIVVGEVGIVPITRQQLVQI